MDDLNVSFKYPWEITKMAILLSKIYDDFYVQHGKKLEYLDMDLNYTIPGEAKISMIPSIEKILKDFPEEIVETAATPAGEHLFEVQEDTNLTNYLRDSPLSFIILWQNYCSYATMPGMIYKHHLHSLQQE